MIAKVLITTSEDSIRTAVLGEEVAIKAFRVIERGPAGAAGVSFEFEIPTGVINGSNVTFTTANDFIDISVFLNGLRMISGLDYNVTGANSFDMIDAPLVGDNIAVEYTR